VTRASRFLTGWVTRFATHDGIPAGRSIKTQRQTITAETGRAEAGLVAPVLRKAAGGRISRTLAPRIFGQRDRAAGLGGSGKRRAVSPGAAGAVRGSAGSLTARA